MPPVPRYGRRTGLHQLDPDPSRRLGTSSYPDRSFGAIAMGYYHDPSDGWRAMITDNLGNKIDDSVALHRLVVARDLRFPDHSSPGDRLGRLLAEIGDL